LSARGAEGAAKGRGMVRQGRGMTGGLRERQRQVRVKHVTVSKFRAAAHFHSAHLGAIMHVNIIPILLSAETAWGVIPEKDAAARIGGVEMKIEQLNVVDAEASATFGSAQLVVGIAATGATARFKSVFVDEEHGCRAWDSAITARERGRIRCVGGSR
jgi:hypothetical protein